MQFLAKNKRAYFDYEVWQDFVAGIKLKGYEVKSLKAKQVSFSGSFVSLQAGEVFLKNLNIGKYQYTTLANYDPIRTRKLLLNKKEILILQKALNEKGVTIVPLEIGLQNNLVKVKIALCRGKKKYDKRESLKKKDLDRQIKKRLKNF